MVESFQGKESPRELIIDSNLEKMGQEMIDLLWSESIGGNAGEYEIEGKKYPCGAANGYFNRTNGEIVAFGNIQDTVIKNVKDLDTEGELWGFTFRVAIDMREGPKKIVEIMYDSRRPFTGKDDPIIEASVKEIMAESVERYNQGL